MHHPVSEEYKQKTHSSNFNVQEESECIDTQAVTDEKEGAEKVGNIIQS